MITLARLVRVGVATAFLVCALSAARLTLPGLTVACSCAAPPAGAPFFDGREQAVLIGSVGADDGSGIFPFAVERWFKGGSAAEVRLASATQRLPDGSFVMNSCGVDLNPGSHLILVAFPTEGVYSPNACSPLAVVESPEGQRLFEAAVATFGGGLVPGEPPPERSPEPSIDLAAIALVSVLAVVAVIVVGVAIAALGHRRDAQGSS